MSEDLVLEMNNILKTFPGGVIANNNVNLKLKKKEIHALLGENGAGKSTLMNILYGLYEQDSGEIFIKGEKIKITSPKDAIANGLGMVQQDFTLVPSFSVAENIILGINRIGFKPNYKKIYKEIEELSKRYELNIDPRTKVWQLSIGEKQRVEILKLLYRNAEILILDEPTAVLTPQETKALLKTLRKMADEGHSIIFITHKLEEVMQITDQVTVMRDGQEVGVFKTSETTQKELANAMVGRSVILKIDKSP
ncbi:MAG: ATP-binding cassette domain-containing protein, partial [Bacillota bacterium]